MSTRRRELLDVIGDNPVIKPLVDDMIMLECQLEDLRGLPMIRVDANNPARQKSTPAAKQYKEFLQQYVNVVKLLLSATGTAEIEEDSPLKQWMNEHLK